MAATATKERPMIFTAESVLAILAGLKTQTRRVVKPQPIDFYVTGEPLTLIDAVPGELMARRIVCPYGKPGDRLWVKESYRYQTFDAAGNHIEYRADGAVLIKTSEQLSDTRKYYNVWKNEEKV